jgi:hypothetical protein
MKLDTDNIYYNFNIVNDASQLPLNSFPTIFASKEENLNDSLLENPSEFYMAINRFSISGKSLPLMVFPILGGLSQSNPNLSPWTISLKYLNNVYTRPIIYLPSNDLQIPPAPSANNGVQKIDPYYYIYYYQDLAIMINSALSLAYNDLKTAFPLAPIGQAPYLVWLSNPNNIFRLIVDEALDATITPAPNTVELYMNELLSLILSSITTKFYLNPPLSNFNLVNQIIIKKLPNGDNEYFVNGTATTPNTLFIDQEFSSISYINSVKSIVFLSNTLGAQKEFIASKGNGGTLSGLSIVQDFEFDFTKAGSVQEYIYFNSNGVGNYRLVDIKSTTALNKIDISVYWQDAQNNLYPLILFPNTYVSIKIIFVRKSLYRTL